MNANMIDSDTLRAIEWTQNWKNLTPTYRFLARYGSIPSIRIISPEQFMKLFGATGKDGLHTNLFGNCRIYISQKTDCPVVILTHEFVHHLHHGMSEEEATKEALELLRKVIKQHTGIDRRWRDTGSSWSVILPKTDTRNGDVGLKN